MRAEFIDRAATALARQADQLGAAAIEASVNSLNCARQNRGYWWIKGIESRGAPYWESRDHATWLALPKLRARLRWRPL